MICNECNQNVALEYLGSNEFIFSMHHEPNTPPHRRCALSCDTLCVGTGDIISSDEELDASPAFHVGDVVCIKSRGTYTLEKIELRKTSPIIIYHVARDDQSFWTDDSEVDFVSCNHV